MMHNNPTRRTISGLTREIGLRIIHSYCLGLQAAWIVPAVLAPVAIIELIQHIVEIRIGMFDSLSAAKHLQHALIRSYIGIPKVFASWLTALLIARFWANGRLLRQALRVPWQVAIRLIAGIAGMMALSSAVATTLEPVLGTFGTALSAIAPIPILFWAVGSWLDQNRVTLVEAFTTRLIDALILVIVFAASVPVMQGIHILIHKAVIGQSVATIWLSMTIDALLVVPLGAALHGSALFSGYRAGRDRKAIPNPVTPSRREEK